MVFGADDVHAHFVIGAVAFDETLIGGARGGHYVFLAQVIKPLDATVLGGQQLAFDVDKPVGKRHLLLTFSRNAS